MTNTATVHAEEVSSHERFEFGRNWANCLETLDEGRIEQAEQSLQDMLGTSDLPGKDFLDSGSASGPFSLAARRRGARVYSFDSVSQSVSLTWEVGVRHFVSDNL